MTKKTTTIVEEDIVPEVNQEAEKHDQAVLEALEGKEEAALTIEPDKLDETPIEDVKVEEPKIETPVIDKEAIKAELKDEVTKDVKDQIVSQLQGTKEEQKDAYADFEKNIWDKAKRTPTYKEALDFIKVQAKDEIKAELNAEIEEEQKQAEETKKAQEEEQAKAQQELNANLNKDWDEQLDDLVKAGRIPAIKDPNNNQVQIIKNAEGKEIERIPLEPGKRARYNLFKAMYVASEERINNPITLEDGTVIQRKPITNLKEVYLEHYNPNKQPAGANAPIAGVRKSVSQDSGTSFKYSEIHGPLNTVLPRLLEEAQ